MHMIRNAADHGIEMPNERVKWGKVRKGTIKVAVIELPDLVEISIEDDGRGLDLVAIRKKAESMGIIDTTSVLSDEQLHNLVFISGLSTATMVTDISGRGVGMDVVRRNLEKIGGTISLSSNPNSGTSIALKIPKNIGTQIVDGFLVRISDEHYILPVKHIEESFTAIRSDFTNVNGNGWCVMRRNTLLPYSSLAALLGDSNMGNQRFEDVTVVVLRSKTALFGLGVDAILGLQQVVLKQVSGMPFTNTLFCGAAITGSGTVSMVLDVEYIIGKGKSL